MALIKPLNELFADAVEYQNCRFINKLALYNDDIANGLNCMAKRIIVQRKDRNFNSKSPVSITALIQDFKGAWNVCRTRESASMCLFMHYLSGPVESVINGSITLPTETARAEKRWLASFYEIVNYFFEKHATDDNIVIFDAEIWLFRQQGLMVTNFAQQFWTKTLPCGSVYN